MKRHSILCAAALLILSCACEKKGTEEIKENPSPTPVTPTEESGFVYKVYPDKVLGEISPYIYGSNVLKGISHKSTDHTTAVRLGGNRLTGYNWENNASNAGSDWNHSSDSHLVSSVIEGSVKNEVGSVATTFIKSCLNTGQYPIMTVPMCYKVAADMNGNVAEGDESRWNENLPRLGSEFPSSPDLTDGKVYADEFVNYLANVKGYKGKVAYSLDNEPDLWQSTHPRICPKHISSKDFVERTVEYASAIKDVDPDAMILGFVSFGYSGYNTFSSAPDWNTIKTNGDYGWFIDYFLQSMNKAAKQRGSRLVDVLDLHWYPEAKGDNRVNKSDSNTDADKRARLQAPRSLWDPTYKETSWITQTSGYHLPLLPEIQASIDRYAPGTKLSFTEFNYGGYEDATGAVALAEVLGIFGKYGVWAACHWGNPGTYGNLAYRLYRDYDGNGSCFGDTIVESTLSKTWENTSQFASVDAEGRIHLIITNKRFEDPIEAKIRIQGMSGEAEAQLYIINGDKTAIQGPGIYKVTDGKVNLNLPPVSVAHVVIQP